MFAWFRKNPNKDPRVILEQALFDFGAETLIPQALEFFDDHSTFEEFLYANKESETSWEQNNYEPKPPEIAYEIFYYLLSSTQRIGYLDWADGIDIILEVFTELLKDVAAMPLSEEEIKMFREKTMNAKRGKAFMILYDDLDTLVNNRGFELTYFCIGDDAHHPIILTKEVYKRWISAKFGRGFPVIP